MIRQGLESSLSNHKVEHHNNIWIRLVIGTIIGIFLLKLVETLLVFITLPINLRSLINLNLFTKLIVTSVFVVLGVHLTERWNILVSKKISIKIILITVTLIVLGLTLGSSRGCIGAPCPDEVQRWNNIIMIISFLIILYLLYLIITLIVVFTSEMNKRKNEQKQNSTAVSRSPRLIKLILFALVIFFCIIGLIRFRGSQFAAIDNKIPYFARENVEEAYVFCNSKVNLPTTRLKDYCYLELASVLKSDQPCLSIKSLKDKDLCFGLVSALVKDYEICKKIQTPDTRKVCILTNDMIMLGKSLGKIKEGNTKEGLNLCDKIRSNNGACYLAYLEKEKELGNHLDSSFCDKFFVNSDFFVLSLPNKENQKFINEAFKQLNSGDEVAKERCLRLTKE